MHSVEENLLRSRYSVESETDTASGRKRASRRERQKKEWGNEAICIQSKKACYEAATQSEAKPTLHQEDKEQAEEKDRKKNGCNDAV
jgi:hypothetical protein